VTIDVSGNIVAKGNTFTTGVYPFAFNGTGATNPYYNQYAAIPTNGIVLSTGTNNSAALSVFPCTDASNNTFSAAFGVNTVSQPGSSTYQPYDIPYGTFDSALNTIVNVGSSFYVASTNAGQVITKTPSPSFSSSLGPTVVYLGRGYTLSVTNTGRLQVQDGNGRICKAALDTSSNEYQSYSPVTEPPFADLTPGVNGAVNIVDASLNGWSYLSGTQQVVYEAPDSSAGNLYGGYKILGNNDIPTHPIYANGSVSYANNYVNTWFGTSNTYGDMMLQFRARVVPDTSSWSYDNGGVIPHAWTVPRKIPLLDNSGNTVPTYINCTTGVQVEVAYPSQSDDLEFNESPPYSKGTIVSSGQFLNTEQMKALVGDHGEWVNYKVMCLGYTQKVWINGVQTGAYYEDIQNNTAVARNTGKIAIQGHITRSGNLGDYTEYQNIVVRPLSLPKFTVDSSSYTLTIASKNSLYYYDYRFVNGGIQWLNDGSGNALTGIDSADFTTHGQTWTGKIALIICNTSRDPSDSSTQPPFNTTKCTNAYNAGCVGVIIYNYNYPGLINYYTGQPANYNGNESLSLKNTTCISQIPVGSITWNSAQSIITYLSTHPSAQASMEGYFTTRQIPMVNPSTGVYL